MKRTLILLSCVLGLVSSCTFDDSKLRKEITALESRVAALEQLCDEMSENVLVLQQAVNTLQDGIMISRIVNLGNGYAIYFSDGSNATIYNGRNSESSIGVKKAEDGNYYWALGSKWLTDENGNKVKAQIAGEKNTEKKKCCLVRKKVQE